MLNASLSLSSLKTFSFVSIDLADFFLNAYIF